MDDQSANDEQNRQTTHEKTTQSRSRSIKSEEIEWLCPSLTSADFDSLKAFGMATWLWTHSSLHRDWPVHLLATTIWPAVVHRQFLLARDVDRRPIAFVSWAKLDEARERRYLQDANSLTHDDWHCGDRIWFIDWLAPFGGTRAVARKIEYDIFPDSAGHSLHVKKGSATARIYDHFGRNVSTQHKQLAVEQLKRNLVAAFDKEVN